MHSVIRFCVPKVLNDQQRADAVTVAIQENELNRREVVSESGVTLAVEVGKLWQNGKDIHVRFLNGDAVQRAKCEREAHVWEQYANIKFVFDDAKDAPIRVAFFDGKTYTDDGSWSYIGTDALMAPKNEQTVNFGWLNKDTPDEEWHRVVVHEFGHAIGADHEDQQPGQHIQWNKPVVYRYFTGPPNNWTKQMVDENILMPTPDVGIAHTDFDPNSIMAYSIPPEFTLDHTGIPGGNTLSDKDKSFITQMYPKVVAPSVGIKPGQPFITARIDIAQPVNTFSLPIIQKGQYRVWTSFLAGLVAVTGPDGKLVNRSLQQVVFDASPGQYVVTVSPQKPGLVADYRIVSRKIS